ncbi:hypothetical protein V2J09_017965 [Rumex salicifolius]
MDETHLLLLDILVEVHLPIILFCDKLGRSRLVPCFHEQTKHLEIDAHFTRWKIQKDFLYIAYIHTNLQIAEFITKALGKLSHEFVTVKCSES